MGAVALGSGGFREAGGWLGPGPAVCEEAGWSLYAEGRAGGLGVGGALEEEELCLLEGPFSTALKETQLTPL